MLVHMVRDEDEQNDEDVKHRIRLHEEVEAHDQESLNAISASDGTDHPSRLPTDTHRRHEGDNQRKN
jgi:hypothetical protein